MFPVLRLLQKVLYKMKKQKYYEQAPIFTEPAHKGKLLFRFLFFFFLYVFDEVNDEPGR